MVPPNLPGYPVYSSGARGSDCSDGVGHFESGDQRAVRTPPADRALDLAALDVCLRDRRGDLPAPLSNLPATVILVRKLVDDLEQALTWFEIFKTPQCPWSDSKQAKQILALPSR